MCVCVCVCAKSVAERNTHSTKTYVVNLISFQTVFVQVFKIIVDS